MQYRANATVKGAALNTGKSRGPAEHLSAYRHLASIKRTVVCIHCRCSLPLEAKQTETFGPIGTGGSNGGKKVYAPLQNLSHNNFTHSEFLARKNSSKHKFESLSISKGQKRHSAPRIDERAVGQQSGKICLKSSICFLF